MSSDTPDNTELVRAVVEFQALLQLAGATKEIFTMKEVMFYLGQYINQNQLYDQNQQHIVHCAQDPLGRVLCIDSFSVKEPRDLFAVLTKNLIAVNSQHSLSSDGLSKNQANKTTEGETQSCTSYIHSQLASSTDRSRRRGRTLLSGDPGPSQSTEAADVEDESEEEEERKKRRRSYSFSLTCDEIITSWSVTGGLGGGRSSQSQSISEILEVTIPASDSDSDNFSVEYEVESIDSDDYEEDDASLSGDDQVYEGKDEDSIDEDTEISEADYWKCGKCEEMNPPLPTQHQLCCLVRQKPRPKESEAKESPESSCSAPNSQEPSSPRPSSSSFSQEKLWTDSLPSSSDCQEALPCSPAATSGATSAPELEGKVSTDPCLICHSRSKNGSIVHGQTGHLMSCFICARKLKKRNKPCPVCRMSIESVILTYFS